MEQSPLGFYGDSVNLRLHLEKEPNMKYNKSVK